MRIGHDVESYKNYFCVGIENYELGKKVLLEISEERNDLDKVYKFYSTYDGEIVSFNGIYYDNLIIQFILKNYDEFKKSNLLTITNRIKDFSDLVINHQQDERVLLVRNATKQWTDIDLFLYWSKMLRLSKKISLKSLGIQLGYPVVQELPFSPSSILGVNDLPTLRVYNMTHDLGILKLLHDNMKEDIDLRAYIKESLGIPCMSMDAPKIASEILLYDYCKTKRLPVWKVRKWEFERKPIHIDTVLRGFDPKFETKVFQDMFIRWKNSYDTVREEFIYSLNNTNVVLTYGIGGLHSVNENEMYTSTNDEIVMTSDVASLYPSLIINYTCIRFVEVLQKYIDVRAERLVAKKNKDKIKDKLFKLILNSISGMLDNKHSWLYFPEGALRMRLIGQLILSKFIEVCALKGWKVVSANTDGIEVIIPKNQKELYIQTLDEAVKQFDMILEHEEYDFIYYKNVNNYIAKVKSDNEVIVKEKGLFKRKPELGNSVDNLVIAKALYEYYVNGNHFEEVITNPEKYNLHIYDYCKSNKVGRDFAVIWNNKPQQRLNRYYFSKNAPYIFKKKLVNVESLEKLIDTRTQQIMMSDPYITEESAYEAASSIIKEGLQHMNVGQGVKLFNNYKKSSFFEYDVNYSYYIKQCRDIVDSLNKYNQLTLF